MNKIRQLITLIGVWAALIYPCISMATQPIGIAVGNYSTINYDSFPLLALASKQGLDWTYPADILNKLTFGERFGNNFLVSSCNSHLCIAAGQYWDKRSRPLIALSQNDGRSWSYLTKFPDEISHDGSFNIPAATCNSTMCVVIFTYKDHKNKDNGTAVMASTNDNGKTWEFSKINEEINSRYLELSGLDCTEKTCVAVGSSGSDNTPYSLQIAVSKDQAKTWSYIKTNFPPEYQQSPLDAVKCKDNVCIAVGKFILRSQDGGDSWSVIPNSHLDTSYFYYVTRNDKTWIITGTEKQDGISVPLILVSEDNGMTWSKPPSIISQLPTTLRFVSVAGTSCDNNFCAFPVYHYQTDTIPPLMDYIFLLALSQDYGLTWSYVDISPANVRAGTLNDMSCNQNYCFVAGSTVEQSYQNKPFLIMSNDHGKSWHVPSSIFKQLPDNYERGEFRQ